ncbi:MAG: hypothetical protein ACOH1N_14145 [Lutibacter sp.]
MKPKFINKLISEFLNKPNIYENRSVTIYVEEGKVSGDFYVAIADIMQKYANKEKGEFVEWLHMNNYIIFNDGWFHTNKREYLTITELIQTFDTECMQDGNNLLPNYMKPYNNK